MANHNFKVGQEVVAFYCNGPIQHNHGSCRGIITRIGRKWLFITSNGADQKCSLDDEDLFYALPIQEAKRRYRTSFANKPAHITQEFVDQCVNNL